MFKRVIKNSYADPNDYSNPYRNFLAYADSYVHVNTITDAHFDVYIDTTPTFTSTPTPTSSPIPPPATPTPTQT